MSTAWASCSASSWKSAADRGRLPALRRRELAAIVERARREDPAERYPTVDALTTDIRSFLDQRPVQALHGRAGYGLRKGLARHQSWVAAAAALVLLGAGFTYKVAAESRRAHAAEQAARQAEASSRQVSEFLVSIFEGSNPDRAIVEIPTSALVAQAEKLWDEKDLVAVRRRVGLFLLRTGQREAARTKIVAALDAQTAAGGENSVAVGMTRIALAEWHVEAGEPEKALRELVQAEPTIPAGDAKLRAISIASMPGSARSRDGGTKPCAAWSRWSGRSGSSGANTAPATCWAAWTARSCSPGALRSRKPKAPRSRPRSSPESGPRWSRTLRCSRGSKSWPGNPDRPAPEIPKRGESSHSGCRKRRLS